MAIEIYDKAICVKKDYKYFYFLKYGSKNCFTCSGQSVLDDEFHTKWLKRETRDSDWNMIAYGGLQEFENDAIAETYWNNTTGGVYGRIKFGNGKNIALYFVKNKDKVWNYDELDGSQKSHIDNLIRYYEEEDKKRYTIDLRDIPEIKKMKPVDDYCGRSELIQIGLNAIMFAGKHYWNLDNL